MPQTLIFDIETCINTTLLRQVGDQKALVLYQQGEFMPLIYHEPISIAIGTVSQSGVLERVESLPGAMFGVPSPGLLAKAFWEVVNTGVRLVSFNGRSFDLPVLELMALRYGIEAPKYWGDKYGARNRYNGEAAHLDLLEVLTNFGAYRLQGGLNALVRALGYGGKGDMDGSQVQASYDAGCYEAIHAYCRLDVIRTYAVFLQLERVRGQLSARALATALEESKPFLDQIGQEKE